VLDALADVLEGGGRRRRGLAAQRLDLPVQCRQLAGQVGGPVDRGVTVGQGDAELGLEPLDGVGHLTAVVSPQHDVERVLGLVVRQQFAAGIGHVLILAEGSPCVSVSGGLRGR
jgi:hypothetical protein